MPDIEHRFFQKYKAAGLAVVAIDPNAPDYGQASEVDTFVETLGVTYPVGVEDSATYEQFVQNFPGVNPYPVDVLVDKQGIIRYIAREYDPAAMDAKIQQLLAE